MAASQSETAGLLASDDVVRPRGARALTSWKAIGGGLTVRPRCAILGRDETSPTFSFRDRLTRATLSPLVPQALALVGAGCVAATRGRAAHASLGGIADDFAYLADVPDTPQLTESAGLGEKRLPPGASIVARAVSAHEPIDAPRARTPSPAALDILDDFAYLKALDSSPAADALRSAVAALAAESAGKTASRDEGAVQGAVPEAVPEAVQAVPQAITQAIPQTIPQTVPEAVPASGVVLPEPPRVLPGGVDRPALDDDDDLAATTTTIDPPVAATTPTIPTAALAAASASASASAATSAASSSAATPTATVDVPSRAPTVVPSAIAAASFGLDRTSGGGYVYGPGGGRCPAPASARVASLGDATSAARRLASPSSSGSGSPLNSFTALGADLLAIGDSTDKLWMLSGCSALLPSDERCDPSMAHMGIPDVTQIPHNMRPYACEPGVDVRCDAPARAAADARGCCPDGSSREECCMTRDESRTAAACATRHGAAGSLHVLGPGEGPYDDPRLAADTAGYDGFQLPRSTPLRVDAALERFLRWSRANARDAAAEFDAMSPAELALRATALGSPQAVVAAAADAGPRPTVVVINTNYWAQKYGLADAKTPEAREAFVRKYAADLEALTTRVAGRLRADRAKGGGGGCAVLRTQHDMLGASREAANERTREVNAAIEEVGERTGTPVFPWARLFNEHLEENVFDGWCHQWGDASLYMQRRFNSWAATHLPKECFARGRGAVA